VEVVVVAGVVVGGVVVAANSVLATIAVTTEVVVGGVVDMRHPGEAVMVTMVEVMDVVLHHTLLPEHLRKVVGRLPVTQEAPVPDTPMREEQVSEMLGKMPFKRTRYLVWNVEAHRHVIDICFTN